MKNIILIAMLAVAIGCGKEESSVTVNVCPAGVFELTNGTTLMGFSPAGDFSLFLADGCLYEGTHICNASEGMMVLNLNPTPDEACDLSGAVIISFSYTGAELTTSYFGMPGTVGFNWSKQ